MDGEFFGEMLKHLVQVAERGDGKAVVSIVSLPKETWIAVPLVGYEVGMEDLRKLREMVMGTNAIEK